MIDTERERLAQWCDGEAEHWNTGDSAHKIARDRYRAIAAALRAPPAPAADDGEIADKAYALLGAHDVSFPDDGERKDFLCALIDLLTAPPAQSAAGWRPISEAAFGQEWLLWAAPWDRPMIAWWTEEGDDQWPWEVSPTHFAPLPTPPAGGGGA